jgi:fermentation-respiration switch protein FrsA (DUF1100 family)
MHMLQPLTYALLLALLALSLPRALHAQSQAFCAQTVTVQSGDTLSTIAARTLGSQQAYRRIVDATNAQAATDPSFARIANANVLAVGWKLCIPVADAPVLTAAQAGVETPAGLRLDNLLELTDIAASVEAALSARAGPDGLHPLTIDYLRRRQYPGSVLTFEQALSPGPTYSRALVAYQSEGLKIRALLAVPNGPLPATGWPVVILNHGYVPPALYRPTGEYEPYLDAFARHGYLVLQPGLRGHGDSEGTARGAYGDPGYVIDVLNALASIRQLPGADPQRIGMWGHSMGGYLTLRAMVVSGEVEAGVIWAGVVGSYADMLSLWDSRAAALPPQAQRWHDALVARFGTPGDNPTFWAAISANSYLADLSGPVQIHHGTADAVVPPELSAQLYVQLQAARKPAEYYVYPGDDHNLSASFDLAMARALAFMDTYVKGKPE